MPDVNQPALDQMKHSERTFQHDDLGHVGRYIASRQAGFKVRDHTPIEGVSLIAAIEKHPANNISFVCYGANADGVVAILNNLLAETSSFATPLQCYLHSFQPPQKRGWAQFLCQLDQNGQVFLNDETIVITAKQKKTRFYPTITLCAEQRRDPVRFVHDDIARLARIVAHLRTGAGIEFPAVDHQGRSLKETLRLDEEGRLTHKIVLMTQTGYVIEHDATVLPWSIYDLMTESAFFPESILAELPKVDHLGSLPWIQLLQRLDQNESVCINDSTVSLRPVYPTLCNICRVAIGVSGQPWMARDLFRYRGIA